MLKLDFCNKWVELVMRCVRTVSYFVLINGSPSTVFTPGRGIRQGGPLSPYLFLLCAEAFSALLRRAEVENEIHGMQVAHQAPVISHMFFADDTLLFCRATRNEAGAVNHIIKQYEKASGQRINMEKTDIFTVSSNISGTMKTELSQLLGVKEVEQHTKYLGLPTLIGRSKKRVFAGTMERILQKIKDWKEKSLSQAGKEVLIKSVIQSIPSYVMNCFLFPTTLCKKLKGQQRDSFGVHRLKIESVIGRDGMFSSAQRQKEELVSGNCTVLILLCWLSNSGVSSKIRMP